MLFDNLPVRMAGGRVASKVSGCRGSDIGTSVLGYFKALFVFSAHLIHCKFCVLSYCNCNTYVHHSTSDVRYLL